MTWKRAREREYDKIVESRKRDYGYGLLLERYYYSQLAWDFGTGPKKKRRNRSEKKWKERKIVFFFFFCNFSCLTDLASLSSLLLTSVIPSSPFTLMSFCPNRNPISCHVSVPCLQLSLRLCLSLFTLPFPLSLSFFPSLFFLCPPVAILIITTPNSHLPLYYA